MQMKIRKLASIGKRIYVELPTDWIEKYGLVPGDTVYMVEKDGELSIIPLPSLSKK